MAVKVLIKRIAPQDTAKAMIPFFREMREVALNQPGYISGETLKNIDNPEESLVISTWESAEDWQNWLHNAKRIEIQSKIDILLGGTTEYKIFHSGFGG